MRTIIVLTMLLMVTALVGCGSKAKFGANPETFGIGGRTENPELMVRELSRAKATDRCWDARDRGDDVICPESGYVGYGYGYGSYGYGGYGRVIPRHSPDQQAYRMDNPPSNIGFFHEPSACADTVLHVRVKNYLGLYAAITIDDQPVTMVGDRGVSLSAPRATAGPSVLEDTGTHRIGVTTYAGRSPDLVEIKTYDDTFYMNETGRGEFYHMTTPSPAIEPFSLKQKPDRIFCQAFFFGYGMA